MEALENIEKCLSPEKNQYFFNLATLNPLFIHLKYI